MGSVVPPTAPRVTAGTYWGYSVRMADSFSSVFTNSPYKVKIHNTATGHIFFTDCMPMHGTCVHVNVHVNVHVCVCTYMELEGALKTNFPINRK